MPDRHTWGQTLRCRAVLSDSRFLSAEDFSGASSNELSSDGAKGASGGCLMVALRRATRAGSSWQASRPTQGAFALAMGVDKRGIAQVETEHGQAHSALLTEFELARESGQVIDEFGKVEIRPVPASPPVLSLAVVGQQ